MAHRPFSPSEFTAFARRLESFHELFCALWQVGQPVFTDMVDTAAIVFDSNGAPLRFLFNQRFYENLPDYDRDFVVCHEMLHAVLNHGFRFAGIRCHALANIAADIVVNHLLVSQFGFMRELLQNWQALCWVDTVFSSDGKKLPPTNLTMEEYYAMLVGQVNLGRCKLVDEHFFEPGPVGNLRNFRAANEMDSWLAGLGPVLSRELAEMLGAEARVRASRGSLPVGAWCSIEPVRPMPVPWEKVIRARLARNSKESIVEGWVETPRRYAAVHDLITPGTMRRLRREDQIQRCVFFLDASGSVWAYRDRFFGFATSLPPDKYRVELCSFDTEVYPLDIRRPEVRGGGGTSFAALEDWLLKRSKEPKSKSNPRGYPYPDVVIVITDGYGGDIAPQIPERWHWLLTTDFEAQIPRASVRYRLSEFS